MFRCAVPLATLLMLQLLGATAQAAPVIPEAVPFAEDYMEYLDSCRTEVEATWHARDTARREGFRDLATLPAGTALAPGDRVYWVNHDRAIILAIIGTKPVADGVRLLAGHTDAPRLDLKAHPVTTREGFFQFQTYPYGGIKRYQWVNVPLQLHGFWYDAADTRHEIIIGDDPDEPTILIPDLEPHLSRELNARTASEAIGAEELDPIIGMQTRTKAAWNAADQRAAQGLGEEESTPAIPEDEFLAMLTPYLESGTLTATSVATGQFHLVPATRPRFCGFDKSMIAGYGQDDRVNCYAALRALLALDTTPAHTAMVYLVGQEEVGSVNNIGASSTFLNRVIASLLERDPRSPDSFGDNLLRSTLSQSWVLSTDTPPAVNPLFPDVWESGNTLRLGQGPAVLKWGAGRDGQPEYFAQVAAIFDRAGIPWQVAPLGKNGMGGGGTIGGFMSKEGMEVIDIGVTLLSMHSPYEIASVDDLWNGYRAFLAFLADGG